MAQKDDAVNELFIDGRNACLFEKEQDIPDILCSLFTDEAKMKMLSSNAQTTVETYSAETFANRVEDAYKNAIARHVRSKAIRRANVGKIHSSRKLKKAKMVPIRSEDVQDEQNGIKANAKKAYRAAARYAHLLRLRKR